MFCVLIYAMACFWHIGTCQHFNDFETRMRVPTRWANRLIYSLLARSCLDFLLCEEYQKLTQNQGKWIGASAVSWWLCDIRHCILMAVAVAGVYINRRPVAVATLIGSENITWTGLFENFGIPFTPWHTPKWLIGLETAKIYHGSVESWSTGEALPCWAKYLGDSLANLWLHAAIPVLSMTSWSRYGSRMW